MLFHGGVAGFTGGFVGVDVFFVISGYLITCLILGEMSRGEFTLAGFYERRARRILPALFLVIACCLPFTWLWMLPPELQEFGRSVMAVLMFLSNFLFFQEAGYFGPNVDLLPLIHTWSLAVEEQFYLLYPLLLMILFGFGSAGLASLLFFIALLSLLLSGFFTAGMPDFAFYLLPTRAWELLFGALTALYLAVNPVSAISLWMRNIAAFLGLMMIGYAVASFDENTVFPGWAALVPVTGTVLIILFADFGTLVNRILQLRPFVFVGLISYSAYLWHQPLFAFARIRSFEQPATGMYILLIALSLSLAWISWRYVERPFRNREKIDRTQVFRTVSYSTIILLGIGITLDSNEGYPSRLPESYVATLAQSFAVNPRESECNSGARLVPLAERCVYGNPDNVTVAIWGDSHADALALGLGDALDSVGRGLVEHTHNACPPSTGLLRPGRQDACADFNEEVVSSLVQNENIDAVVMLSRWSLYVEGTAFDNGEGGVESISGVYAVPEDEQDLNLESDQRKERIADRYVEQVLELLEQGKRVVLVHPVPEAGWDVPAFLAREIQFGVEREEFLSTSYARYQERHRVLLEAFRRLPASPDLIHVMPQAIFCNNLLADRCVLQDGMGPLYSDDDHLNNRANAVIAQYIVAALGYE